MLAAWLRCLKSRRRRAPSCDESRRCRFGSVKNAHPIMPERGSTNDSAGISAAVDDASAWAVRWIGRLRFEVRPEKLRLVGEPIGPLDPLKAHHETVANLPVAGGKGRHLLVRLL